MTEKLVQGGTEKNSRGALERARTNFGGGKRRNKPEPLRETTIGLEVQKLEKDKREKEHCKIYDRGIKKMKKL